MSPPTKLHSLVFSIATAFVFLLWNCISNFYAAHWLISFIVYFVISAAFYKHLYNIAVIICKEVTCLKKWALGQYYFEGLWIGFYTVNDEKEYYYEIFEQNLEELSIKGVAFDSQDKPVETWSILHPHIDISASKFTYYYELNDFANPEITLGYSCATIFRNRHHDAYKLLGFAVDKYFEGKQSYISVKVDPREYKGHRQEWINTCFFAEVHKQETDLM